MSRDGYGLDAPAALAAVYEELEAPLPLDIATQLMADGMVLEEIPEEDEECLE